MSERRADQAWVFWDGTCGFCRRAVDWIKRQDRHDRLFPVPYQVAPRPPMTEALARRCAPATHDPRFPRLRRVRRAPPAPRRGGGGAETAATARRDPDHRGRSERVGPVPVAALVLSVRLHARRPRPALLEAGTRRPGGGGAQHLSCHRGERLPLEWPP